MNQIVVGSKDCSVYDLYDAINASPQISAMLRSKCGDFALNLRLADYQKFQTGLLLGTYTVQTVYVEILNTWSLDNGDNATLDKVIKALEGIGNKASADAVRNRFQQVQGASTLRAFEPMGDSPSNEPLYDRQEAFMTRYKPQLMELTILHALLLATLEAKQVLHTADTQVIDSIQVKFDKNQKFYEIMKPKLSRQIDDVINAFDKHCQQAVADILRQYPRS